MEREKELFSCSHIFRGDGQEPPAIKALELHKMLGIEEYPDMWIDNMIEKFTEGEHDGWDCQLVGGSYNFSLGLCKVITINSDSKNKKLVLNEIKRIKKEHIKCIFNNPLRGKKQMLGLRIKLIEEKADEKREELKKLEALKES